MYYNRRNFVASALSSVFSSNRFLYLLGHRSGSMNSANRGYTTRRILCVAGVCMCVDCIFVQKHLSKNTTMFSTMCSWRGREGNDYGMLLREIIYCQ